jgi:cysteinyl-tRNA synthetase
MEGSKISKSAGKFPVVDDLIAAGIDPLAFRLMCFGAKYRSELAFSIDAVRAAEKNLYYLQEFARSSCDAVESVAPDWTNSCREQFRVALNNDLNTAEALAVVLDLVAESYRRHDLSSWNLLSELDAVLALGLARHRLESSAEVVPAHIRRLSEERDQARKAKNFKRADEIRQELDALGYEIRDSKAGPVIAARRKAS